MKLKVNGGWWQFTAPLRDLEPFKTHGSLYGRKHTPGAAPFPGRTPKCHLPMIRECDYIVFSYDTAIAWHHPAHGWIMPDETYSVTTSKQQGRIRTAISQL